MRTQKICFLKNSAAPTNIATTRFLAATLSPFTVNAFSEPRFRERVGIAPRRKLVRAAKPARTPVQALEKIAAQNQGASTKATSNPFR
jgi:hypothetical protein